MNTFIIVLSLKANKYMTDSFAISDISILAKNS